MDMDICLNTIHITTYTILYTFVANNVLTSTNQYVIMLVNNERRITMLGSTTKRYRFLHLKTRSPGLKRELLRRAKEREAKIKQQLNKLREITNGMDRS